MVKVDYMKILTAHPTKTITNKVTDFVSVKPHKRRIKRSKGRSMSDRLKDMGYVAFVIVSIMAIYTKSSYDFIRSLQVKAEAEKRLSAWEFNGALMPPMPTPGPQLPEPTPLMIAVNDDRVYKLEKFLRLKNSPLLPYAGLIVKTADKYDIGWTKIVAISGIESTYGTNMSGKHNAWNIMRFQNGVRIGPMNYSSWAEGIEAISSLLSRVYKETETKAVQEKYCPSYECSSNWVDSVLSDTQEIINL